MLTRIDSPARRERLRQSTWLAAPGRARPRSDGDQIGAWIYEDEVVGQAVAIEIGQRGGQ